MSSPHKSLTVQKYGGSSLAPPERIRAAALRLVLAAGASKRPILEAVQNGDAGYPIAQVTKDVETWWLVDRDAAPLTWAASTTA